MANFNTIIFYDFETGGKKAACSQPLSISALAIDPVRLEIIGGSEFDSYIRPIWDEDTCIKMGIEPVQDEALAVNKITREQLENAPSLQEVWSRFTSFVKKYQSGASQWGAPIKAGFNNNNFDDPILQRIASPTGYNLGPWDSEYQTISLFHPIHSIDLMRLLWTVFEAKKGFRSLSFDTMRNYFGMSSEGAHSSRVDVLQGACLLIKYLRWKRNVVAKVKLEKSMEGIDLLDFYDVRPI
jgi:DNA polymerase III epsilon subunit-like protein